MEEAGAEEPASLLLLVAAVLLLAPEEPAPAEDEADGSPDEIKQEELVNRVTKHFK